MVFIFFVNLKKSLVFFLSTYGIRSGSKNIEECKGLKTSLFYLILNAKIEEMKLIRTTKILR